MENAGIILSVSMLVVMLVSSTIGSFKAGINAFSIASLLGPHRRKFEVDKSKIELFTVAIFSALFIYTIYAAIITLGDMMTALLFGLMNTLVSSYALVYMILLKEKKDNTKH